MFGNQLQGQAIITAQKTELRHSEIQKALFIGFPKQDYGISK